MYSIIPLLEWKLKEKIRPDRVKSHQAWKFLHQQVQILLNVEWMKYNTQSNYEAGEDR